MIVNSCNVINDVSLVGGKGYGLFKLVEYGLNVPDFFVIEAGTDINDKSFIDQLNACAAKLNCQLFSVRSSGVSEDGANASFAGQYHTELNVPKERLAEAVYKVCASVAGRGAKAYSKRFANLSCDMAIVVQKQITAIESGVLFSTAPQSDDVLIERVKGSGDNLVSGKAIPQTLHYRKDEIGIGYDNELLNAAKVLEEAEGPVDVEWAYDGKLWFLQLRKQTVLSDIIPTIPDRNWNLYVYRDFSTFSHSVQARASQSDVQRKTFGFSIPITEGLLVCGREFYSDENDVAANRVWAKLDNGIFFDSFLDAISQGVKRVRNRTSAIKNKDFSQLSNEALFAAYEKEIDAYVQSYAPMMMRPDDYLRECLVNLVGEDQANKLIDSVKALLPQTDYSYERTCFLRAVANGDSRSYIDKYEWKNNPLGKRLTPVTEQEFASRALDITPERAKELICEAKRIKRAEALLARKVLSAMHGEELRLTNLINRFTYFRTRTAETSDRYFYYIRKTLLAEIAKRFSLDDETLMLYRVDEIKRLRDGNPLSQAQLTKRKNGEAIIFGGGDVKTYFGANAYTLLRRLLPAVEQTDVVRGKIACAGEVSGIVKVVQSFADAESMDAGYILVASMTTPDLTLAMEKATGIITDEGGITCHAAIIAREYAVPCLVGTKVATQVLRDGMKVQLDCANGYFKIIENK